MLIIPLAKKNLKHALYLISLYVQKKYSVTVTAVGILITLIIFLLQQWKQRIDNIKKYNEEKYDFLSGLLVESLIRKELLKQPKTSENNFEIFDFEFPNEIYDKTSLHVFSGLEQGTTIMIRDFYGILKKRNTLYNYRMATKVNNVSNTNEYFHDFIAKLDKQLSKNDEYISMFNDDLIKNLTTNLTKNEKQKNSEKIKEDL